jgi:ParB/RepB/Spo0J family partition protein
VITKYAAWKVPFECIVVNTPNVRDSYDVDKFHALKESIRVNGVQQAIHLRKLKGQNIYELVHGYNRYEAVRQLREEGVDIPFVLSFTVDMSEEEVLFFHISANSGVELSESEISKILHRLSKYGYSNKQLAEKLGYSEMKVSNLLKYQNSTSQHIKNMVADGIVSVSTAVEIARQVQDTNEQTELIENALKEKVAKGGAKKISLAEITNKVKFDPNKRFGEVLEMLHDSETKTLLTDFFYMLNDKTKSIEEVARIFYTENVVE